MPSQAPTSAPGDFDLAFSLKDLVTPPEALLPPDRPLLEYAATNPGTVVAVIFLFLLLFLALLLLAVRNIRTLKRRGAKLRHQKAELEFQKQALDLHAIVTTVDAEGRIKYVNDNFKIATGFGEREIIGSEGSELWPENLGQAQYAEMLRHMERGMPWSGEIPTRRKDGSEFWAQATMVPFFDGDGNFVSATSIRTDITANKTAEAKRQLTASFDLLTEQVTMFWPDTLEFFYMNRAACEHHGLAEDGYRTRTAPEIFKEFDTALFRQLLDGLVTKENHTTNFEFRTKDNRVEDVTLHYLSPEGQKPRIVSFVRDVTREARQMAELQDLRTALDLADYEVFIIDPRSLRYTYLNRAALRRVGWAADDYQHRTPGDDDPDFSEKDFRDRVQPLVDGSARVITFERENLHNRPTEVSVQLLNLGRQGKRFVVVVRDISDRKRWEREIRRFQAALDLSADAVHMFWPETLEIFYANEEACRRHGEELDDLLGKTPMDITPGLTREILERRLEALRSGAAKSLIYETEHQLADGTPIPVEVNLQYIERTHSRPYIAALIRDLTSNKAADKAKSEFVATVSHELRTPLTSIRGALGLVQSGALGPLEDKAQSMIDIAYSNCERLVLLINDILDLEKIEAGKMEFRIDSTDMVSLIRDAIEQMSTYGQEMDVDLSFQGPKTPVQVSVDPDRVMQVLQNLISNAAKFSGKDQTVRLSAEVVGNVVRVMVSDDGTGIPLKAQPTIFEKFTQADGSDVRKKGGTGLGLSICKSIIERLGGTIDFASAPGQGTDFWFDLPLEQPPEQTEPAQVRRKIIVCEDDAQYGVVLKETLEQEGFDVRLCRTARETRRALKQESYAVMTLDLGLPDGSGVELLGELNKPGDSALPVVVITGHATETETADWPQNMAQVFRKPPNQSELVELLRTLSDGREAPLPVILHVEDDHSTREVVRNLLGERARVISASTLGQAKSVLRQQNIDLLLLDIELPDGNGLDLMAELHETCSPKLPVVIFSADEPPVSDDSGVTSVILKSRKTNEEILHQIMSALGGKRISNEVPDGIEENPPRRG